MRLLELRENAALSQQDLAARAGMTRSQISRLENGLVPKPRPSTVRKLADALGVEPRELIVRE